MFRKHFSDYSYVSAHSIMTTITASKRSACASLMDIVTSFNTLLNCPVRFSGSYGGQEIKHFIDYIKYYKNIKCITDEDALQELGNLLTESASTWWTRRKHLLSTWPEALTALETQFTKRRSSGLIYKDILAYSYKDYHTLDDFINDKYELLHELIDPSPSEEEKLQFIYGLFPSYMTTFNSCYEISTLDELKEHVLKFKPTVKIIDDVDVSGRRLVNSRDHIEIRTTEGDTISSSRMEEKNMQDAHLKNPEGFIKIEEQIDCDIMDQIKKIIDESEQDCNNSVMSAGQLMSEKIHINRANTTQNIENLTEDNTQMNLQISSVISPGKIISNTNLTQIDQTNDVQNTTNQPVRKRKVRCSFCRLYGHLIESCYKRERSTQIKKIKMELAAGEQIIYNIFPIA